MSWYRIVRPLLFAFDPETAHGLSIAALRSGLVAGAQAADGPELSVSAFGLDFPNPVGMAAGFDKNAEVPDALLRCGFGFTEVGTVTPRPQSGNPKPRLFRLTADQAIINRLGFNNHGADTVKARLMDRRKAARGGIVGVNIGANRDSADRVADYVRCVDELAGLADYFVINVSSPNTPGLRDLQERAALDDLLSRITEAGERTGGNTPLMVKIAPDLDRGQCEAVAEVCLGHKVAGVIVGNTTLSRPDGLAARHRREAGGLSGRPLFALSTHQLATMYRLTQGRIPLIGAGGISSGANAYEKIRAGATLVQLYSALVYQGFGLVARIKIDLARRLGADGFRSVADAVGTGAVDP